MRPTTTRLRLRLLNWWWLRVADVIKNDPNAVEPRAVLMICRPFPPHDEKKKKKKRAEKRVFTNRRLSENDMYSSEHVPGFSSIPLACERRSGELKTLAQARVWLFSLPLLIVLAAPDEDSLKFSMLLVFHANSRLHVQYISANKMPRIASIQPIHSNTKENVISTVTTCPARRIIVTSISSKIESKKNRIQWLAKQWYIIESILPGTGGRAAWWFCLRPWLITASTNYDVGKKRWGEYIYLNKRGERTNAASEAEHISAKCGM